MIDIFSILLTHGLILLAGWRLLFREDLDVDHPEEEQDVRPWLQKGEAEPVAGGAPDA